MASMRKRRIEDMFDEKEDMSDGVMNHPVDKYISNLGKFFYHMKLDQYNEAFKCIQQEQNGDRRIISDIIYQFITNPEFRIELINQTEILINSDFIGDIFYYSITYRYPILFSKIVSVIKSFSSSTSITYGMIDDWLINDITMNLLLSLYESITDKEIQNNLYDRDIHQIVNIINIIYREKLLNTDQLNDMLNIIINILEKMTHVGPKKQRFNQQMTNNISNFYDHMKIKNYDTVLQLINLIEEPEYKMIAGLTYNYVKNQISKTEKNFVFHEHIDRYYLVDRENNTEIYPMDEIIEIIKYAVKFEYVDFFSNYMPVLGRNFWNIFSINNIIKKIIYQQAYTFDMNRITKKLIDQNIITSDDIVELQMNFVNDLFQ